MNELILYFFIEGLTHKMVIPCHVAQIGCYAFDFGTTSHIS